MYYYLGMLSVIIRTILSEKCWFLDDYVDKVTLNVDAYYFYAYEVHTYIFNFITENPTADDKILPYLDFKNGIIIKPPRNIMKVLDIQWSQL